MGSVAVAHVQVPGNEMEFTAYRLLYAMSHSRETFVQELRKLDSQALRHPYIQHVLQVSHVPIGWAGCVHLRGRAADAHGKCRRWTPSSVARLTGGVRRAQVSSAVRGSNYHTFFCLYGNAPRMTPYLMDVLTARLR